MCARAGYPIILDSQRSGSAPPLLSLRRALEYRHPTAATRPAASCTRRRHGRGWGRGKGSGKSAYNVFPFLDLASFLPSFLPVTHECPGHILPLLFFAKCSLRTSPRGYERVARELDLFLRPPTPDLTFGTSFSPFFSLASPPLSSLPSGSLLVLPIRRLGPCVTAPGRRTFSRTKRGDQPLRVRFCSPY